MKNIALITGASSGIGRELARIHAEKRRDLVIVARRENELQELKAALERDHGVSVRVVAMDLTEADSRRALFDELAAEGLLIDYLFNNAGFGGRGTFHEQDWGKLSAMIELNVTALSELMHLFLPGMVARGRGRVLNTSSTASFMPGPLQAVYFATKAYVTSLSKAVASELEDTPVRVTALCPGAVKTEFAETAEMSDSKLFEKASTPREVAEKGYEAMENGDLECITEVALKAMIKGVIPFLPERVGMHQIKKIQA